MRRRHASFVFLFSILATGLSLAEEVTPAPGEPPPPPAEAAAAAAPAATTPEPPPPSWPVSGVYTAADTKDLGQLTGLGWLSNTKVRGWVDAYFIGNFNTPARSVVDANVGASAVKGQGTTIEGRLFDIHDRTFTLSLVEIELEKVPQRGGAGFKFDLAFGDTQEIIVNTVRAHLGGGNASDIMIDIDRVFQHASLSYVAPVGRGLRFDLGKFVTHVGSETIESVKNWNYSHGFLFTYAIPLNDTGLKISYPWDDTFTTDFYVLNGWNSSIDQNRGLSIGPSISWVAQPWLTLVASYLGGSEQVGFASPWRHLVDAQLIFGPAAGLTAMVAFDYAQDRIEDEDQRWFGVAGYLRYKVADWFEPSVRVEYYRDLDGFTTGLVQDLVNVTATLNFSLARAESGGGMLLLRPEFRWDSSSVPFFTQGSSLYATPTQVTLGLGAAYLF